MTPMQIIDYGMAFLIVCLCVVIGVGSLAITVGLVRDNLSKQP